MENKKSLWIIIGILAFIVLLIVAVKVAGKNQVETEKVKGDDSPISLNKDVVTPQAEDKAVAPVTSNSTDDPTVVALPLAPESVIEANGNSFSPSVIKAKTGEKIFLTFAAKDSKTHTFNFVDEKLSYILITFNKKEGDKSFTFPAPAAGTYTFYVDDKANTGTLIVE